MSIDHYQSGSRWGLAVLAFLVVGAVLPDMMAAQGPPRSWGGGMGRSMARPNLDPVLFNGPPPPEEMLDLVHLEAAQYQAYADQYRPFMENTRVVRDSVLEFRQKMRETREIGLESGPSADQEGMAARRREMDALQRQLETLDRQQKTFDEALKQLLTEDQYKVYEKWRKDERTRAEREMMERMGGPPR